MGRKVKPGNRKNSDAITDITIVPVDPNATELELKELARDNDKINLNENPSANLEHNARSEPQQQHHHQCQSCHAKSEQIAKILKILSQTLVFLGKAKNWRRAGEWNGGMDEVNTANHKESRIFNELATLEENISNFLFSFSLDVSIATLGMSECNPRQNLISQNVFSAIL